MLTFAELKNRTEIIDSLFVYHKDFYVSVTLSVFMCCEGNRGAVSFVKLGTRHRFHSCGRAQFLSLQVCHAKQKRDGRGLTGISANSCKLSLPCPFRFTRRH